MGRTVKNFMTSSKDPNEWTNLAGQEKYADLKTEMASLAPKEFVPHATKLNAKKDLFAKDGSFQWVAGKGNLQKNQSTALRLPPRFL